MALTELENVKADLPKTDPDNDAALTRRINSASSAILRRLRVPETFFDVAGAEASLKIISTVPGLSYLVLPPFVGGIVEVKDANGDLVDPDDYNLDGNRLTISGIGTKDRYTVKARFGWAAVPADLEEACIQLVVRWWRGKDEAFSGVIGNINRDGSIVERGFPAAVEKILEAWEQILLEKGWVLAKTEVTATTTTTQQKTVSQFPRSGAVRNDFIW